MGKGAVVAIVISLLSASAVLLLTKNILSPSDALEDASTYANINEIQTEHFHMDIAINFNRSRIEGKQHLYMMTKRYGVNSVTLDIRGLDIYRVSNEKGENLSWKILTPNPNIGSALVIDIPRVWGKDKRVEIIVEYATNSHSTALTWLKPE